MLANEVEGFYGDQKDLRILDVAAGTGLCGKQVSICILFHEHDSNLNSNMTFILILQQNSDSMTQ